jgi:DNA-binding response OmpR family regulator
VNVLLIEDEEAVSRAHSAILQHAGFKVTAVATAEEAMLAIEKTLFHVLVVDLILPRREGTSFFDDLAAVHPEMAARVLFVTGWGNDPKVRKLIEHTGRPMLAKPVEANELIASVREIGKQTPEVFS